MDELKPKTVRTAARLASTQWLRSIPDMVNPFELSWLWRGLRGNSVTFAALFASVLIGASIAGGFKKLLTVLGVHWLYVILIPLFLFSWLASKEPVWITDERQRKLWARGLIAGSIVLAVLIHWLRN